MFVYSVIVNFHELKILFFIRMNRVHVLVECTLSSIGRLADRTFVLQQL